jgi:hypothetical protein
MLNALSRPVWFGVVLAVPAMLAANSGMAQAQMTSQMSRQRIPLTRQSVPQPSPSVVSAPSASAQMLSTQPVSVEQQVLTTGDRATQLNQIADSLQAKPAAAQSTGLISTFSRTPAQSPDPLDFFRVPKPSGSVKLPLDPK